MGEPLLALRALPRTLVQLTETDISLQIHRERGSEGRCGFTGPGEWARHDPHRCASGRQPRCNCVDASGCSGSIDSFAHPITSLYTIRASAPWRTTWIT